MRIYITILQNFMKREKLFKLNENKAIPFVLGYFDGAKMPKMEISLRCQCSTFKFIFSSKQTLFNNVEATIHIFVELVKLST